MSRYYQPIEICLYEKEFKGWNKDSRLQGLCVVSRDCFTKQRGGYVNDDVCVTLFHLRTFALIVYAHPYCARNS